MTALLEHFHEAVTTPEDVEKLKKLILQLAMQGKLVEQDPNDEPASELLKRIEEEKETLIKEKKIKKTKSLPPVVEDEKAYKIPIGWEWVRLGDIGIAQTGATPSTSKAEYFGGQYPFITPADISENGIDYTQRSLSEIGIEQGRVIPENSVMMVCIGGSIGKCYYTDRLCSCNQQINTITGLCSIKAEFLYYFMSSSYFYESVIGNSTGSATPIINRNKWERIAIPLPPIEEQSRIVKKIKDLFEKSRNLSMEFTKKQTASSVLNKSVFTRLQNHANVEQMKDLRFVIENMEHLCNDKESIAQLRNSILSLAVQGKLVEQNVVEEPASVLIDRIKQEKERLIAEKKIKKEKPLPPISEEEIPYELPKGWEWVRVGDIIHFLGGYAFKSNTYVEDSDFQVIRLGNVKNDKIILQSNPAYIPKEIAKENEQYLIKSNDILVTMTGTRNKRDYFYTCIIDKTESKYLYLNQRVGCLRSIGEVNPHLINLFLKSNIILDLIFDTETGTANQGNIGSNAIKELLFPFPPLEEQDRIVSKAMLLTNQLNNLEQLLNDNYRYQQKLVEALHANVNQL